MTEHTIRIIKRGGADGTKYPVNQKHITFGTLVIYLSFVNRVDEVKINACTNLTVILVPSYNKLV